MLSTKTIKPLAFAVITIVAMAGSTQAAEHKRKRYIQKFDDPYLVFVPGKPLLFAGEHGRTPVFLRYPELDVDRKIDVPADRTLQIVKASPDGTWIGCFFEQSSFRSEGTLRVWKLDTLETHLLRDDAAAAFEFLDNNRLIIWQPKIGITQWALGEGEAKQFGPVITTATNVQVNVRSNGFYLAPDRRYLLTSGRCHGDDPRDDSADYCVYDLSDGSTVGWGDDPETAMTPTFQLDPKTGNRIRTFSSPFSELLIGTNIDLTGGGPPACTPAGQNLELCRSAAAVSLIDTTVVAEAEKPAEPATASTEAPQPAPTPRPAGGFKGILGSFKEAGQAVAAVVQAARATQRGAAKNRRVIWTIQSGDEIGGRFINSCALSADGRWVAVATMGMTVSIFDTTQLQSKDDGAWQEPLMVKQIDLP